MYVLDTQKNMNYLVYIGDLKKKDHCRICVYTTVHVHVWLHGKISIFKINKNQIRSTLVTPCQPQPLSFRACLHGGGGPQVGEVTCFGG